MKTLNNPSIQLPHDTERKRKLTKFRLFAKMVTNCMCGVCCVCARAHVCKAQLVRE